jgi:hypothetical protein
VKRFLRIVLAASLLSLAGCGSFDTSQFDPTAIFEADIFNTKKKLPGERQPVFPDGTPGVSQGVPPEMVKGYQAPAEPEKPAEAKPKAAAKPKEPKAVAKPKEPPHEQSTAAARPTPAAPAPAASAPAPAAQQTQWPDSPAARPASGQPAWPDPPAPR